MPAFASQHTTHDPAACGDMKLERDSSPIAENAFRRAVRRVAYLSRLSYKLGLWFWRCSVEALMHSDKPALSMMTATYTHVLTMTIVAVLAVAT